MGWAEGFQAGTSMAKNWMDVYNQAKQAAEIAQAQEEYKQDPTQSFSTKQGEQLRGLGAETVLDPATGQYVPKYNVSYSPDAGGYEYAANKVGLLAQPPVGVQGEATPVPGAQQPSAYQSLTGAPMEAPVTGRSSTPGVSGLVRPEAYNYMGQRYDTAPTPEQRRMALDARIADIVTQQDPVRGAQMRSDIARNQLTQQQLEAGGIALTGAKEAQAKKQNLDYALTQASSLPETERPNAIIAAIEKYEGPEAALRIRNSYSEQELLGITRKAAANEAAYKTAFPQGEDALIELANKLHPDYQLRKEGDVIYKISPDGKTNLGVFMQGDSKARMSQWAGMASPTTFLHLAEIQAKGDYNANLAANHKQSQENFDMQRLLQGGQIARNRWATAQQALAEMGKLGITKGTEYDTAKNARDQALQDIDWYEGQFRERFGRGAGGGLSGQQGGNFTSNDPSLAKVPAGQEQQFADGSWGRKNPDGTWTRIAGPAAKGGATTAPPPAPAPAPAAAQPAPAAAQPSTVAKPAANTGKPLGKTPVSAPSAAAPGGSMPAPTGAEDRAVQQRIKESQDREKAAADKRFSDLRAKKARGEKLTTSEEAVLRRMEQIRGSGK